VGAALVCRTVVDPFIDNGLYFTFLFPAVLVAGLFGGTWSGISAALFGALLVAFIWMPPRLSFHLTTDGEIRLIAFWCVASMVILLTAFVHAVLDKLAVAEERAATISREMQHRVQNSLTLVQAIARQTFRTADNLAKAQEAFAARIDALGRAQILIDEGFDQSVAVRALMKAALTPFDTGQIVFSGPALTVSKDVGVSFVLLIHELATNAVKYGALSNGEGRVEISWLEEQAKKGLLNWKERYGPAVTEPARIGFGSKLLRAAFAQEGGDTFITFEPDGVRCAIRFPVVDCSTRAVKADVQPIVSPAVLPTPRAEGLNAS
jgi:two-component sensor histidine kinase